MHKCGGNTYSNRLDLQQHGKKVFATIIFHVVNNLCIMFLPLYDWSLDPSVARVFKILTTVIAIFLALHYFEANDMHRE